MAIIDSKAELQEAILVLESKQKEDLKRLKKEFHNVRERLQPKNLIKEGISKVRHSSTIRTGLIIAGVSLISGILIKKVVTRRRRHHAQKMGYKNGNPTRSSQGTKIFVSIIQYILATIISNNSERIKGLAYKLFNSIKHTPTPKPVYDEMENQTK